MPLTNETEDYIASWKKAAAAYQNQDDVEQMFNRFKAKFQIFNRLYNEASLRIGEKQTDEKGATSHTVQYLNADTLTASIEGTKETKVAEEQLKGFIKGEKYHFVLVGEQRVWSKEKDKELLARMESKDKAVRMEGLLHLIYYVRCNLLHGQKHHDPYQLPLMWAVIPILELVVSKTEEKLRM